MNAILNEVINSRNGHYCHVIEVSSTQEMESIAEAIIEEYHEDHNEEVIIDFLESLTVYYLPNEGEQESLKEEGKVYNFSFAEFIEGTI